MYSLGMDLGTSTVKIVLMQNGTVEKYWLAVHHGRPLLCLRQGLSELAIGRDETLAVCVTGDNAGALLERCPVLSELGEIPAIVEGVRRLVPQAGSIIEIGSQGARFITEVQSRTPQFAANEHCAGGTGSFFEDQMSRVGCKLEDYSALVEQAQSIPRLSGRCAVFAKTDIIHRQQEGVSTPDILLGLCYAMIRNYKATIVRRLPVCKPVVFCGGVTCNSGVIRAIRDVFGLTEEELIVPEEARFEAAIGAACKAEGAFTLAQLDALLNNAMTAHSTTTGLPRLELLPGTDLSEPKATGILPEKGCALGIDIGSISTDLVLVGPEGELVDFQYLRTAGDPEGAVRKGLASIREQFGAVRFTAVGVTGSGRERVGKRIGADAVRNEITAQAKGAAHWVPEVDTVFEIGGQDSKYISLKNGEVVDFQMNKICAAGTGSFVEEQAARMGIPLAEFGPLALSAEHPAALGERCTVFIETAIASAAAEGVPQADIAAGLCHAIVQNYLHKVVGSKPVGQHIVLQGGVDYNPGIVAAFQAAYGSRVRVSPVFSISGAYGAALLAQEAVGDAPSQFVGFDSPAQAAEDSRSAEIQRNIDFYRQADNLLLEGYTGKRDPRKKTVGVPFVLMIHKFFPMANAFFTSLGFNVVLTDPTSEETIQLSQQLAQSETCYPVKLIYGHMQQLIDQKVDYIFLPSIHTMKHEKSRVKHNYGCVYMQTAAVSIAKALDIESKGITLLSPVFDLDFGQEAMATAMLGLGKVLGIPKPLCAKALLSGAMAVRRHTAAVEKQGKALLATLKPEDKILVLITRNYGVSDPILNMGIPELLLERGYKVINVVPLCNLLADACFRRGGRNCVNLTQFLRCAFLGSNRVLVVAVSTRLSMFHTVLLSNEELLLLRGEVAPPQLIFADPCEDFFSAFKRERHRGERDFGMFLNDLITVVSVNKGVVPDDQRRKQLAFLEDVFFKLLVLIVRKRRNLILELRVDFQIDHTHTPLSLLLRRFFLPEKQRNILLCGFQFEQLGLGFLVLLVELCLFGCQMRILGFQLVRAGQLGDVVCLEIGHCRPVCCQLCTVLFFKGYGVSGRFQLLRKRSILLVGGNVTTQALVFCHAGFEVFHYSQRFMELGVKLCDSLVECVLVEQSLLLQEDQGLRHRFEVVFFRPTLVADALALFQLRLNIHQFPDAVRLKLNRALALSVFLQGGKHESFLKLVTDDVRPDKLCSASRQIAEPPAAFLDSDAILLHEPVGKIFKAGGTVQHRRNLFP